MGPGSYSKSRQKSFSSNLGSCSLVKGPGSETRLQAPSIQVWAHEQVTSTLCLSFPHLWNGANRSFTSLGSHGA